MVRRTIAGTFREKYGGFCGWSEILQTLSGIKNERSFSIFVGLFITGARANELTTLTRRQIDLDFSEDFIMINGMYVEKQREKILLVDENGEPIFDEKGRRAYKLVSKDGFRTFPIRKDSPLAEYFIMFVRDYPGWGGEYILYPFTYGQIYYSIAQIESKLPVGVSTAKWNQYKGPWWPHRIRAERACQLIRDYHYDVFRLKKWFGWSTSQMPELYGDIVPLDLVEGMERKVRWK